MGWSYFELLSQYCCQSWVGKTFFFLGKILLKLSCQKDLKVDRQCEFWLEICRFHRTVKHNQTIVRFRMWMIDCRKLLCGHWLVTGPYFKHCYIVLVQLDNTISIPWLIVVVLPYNVIQHNCSTTKNWVLNITGILLTPFLMGDQKLDLNIWFL